MLHIRRMSLVFTFSVAILAGKI